MKRRMVILALGCFAAGAVLLVGYGVGFERGRVQASLQEADVAKAAMILEGGGLASCDFKLEPELREYRKGRSYYVVGPRLRYHSGYVSQQAWDVGTVDMEILKRPIFAKGPGFWLTYR